MTTFLVHKNMYLFGNLGEIEIEKLYDAYCNRDDYTGRPNSLPNNYYISGTYRGLPYEATIKAIEKITVNNACHLIISGSGILTETMIVHPNQEFWLTQSSTGETIRAKDIKEPNTQIATLNGAMNIDSVGFLNEPETFYLIETGKLIRPEDKTIMRSIYASNLILLPTEEEDFKDDLDFFIQVE